MSASLVGSEMCIRDRNRLVQRAIGGEGHRTGYAGPSAAEQQGGPREPVSYTHLTLPTICSV
eukprot:12816089-Alexandrium_andersonii.AAC.1